MKTKATIIIIGVIVLVSCGAKLGKWATAESNKTEARFADAFRVMQSDNGWAK